jgi:hypothetical protein
VSPECQKNLKRNWGTTFEKAMKLTR